MKHLALSIFVSLSLLSCNSKKEDVELTILNKQLYFNSKYADSLYFGYENDSMRKLAFNVLKFRIKNNTDKKLLFFVDEAVPGEDLFNKFAPVYAEIFNGRKSVSVGGADIYWATGDDTGKYSYVTEFHETRIWERYRSKGFDPMQVYKQMWFTEHSFTLSPNEYKTFSTILFLPLIREINRQTLTTWYRADNLSSGDSIKLRYNVDPIDYMKCMTEEQIQELKDNNVEIYTGKVLSNGVKLIGR